jgi:site-specific recombinase XerD
MKLESPLEILQMPKDNERMFLNHKGLLISTWQVDNALAKLQKKYPDMKKFRCHDLRHSFAYNYLLKGGNMYSLQQILGHKQIGLTVDLNGGLRARDLKEVSPYGF